MTSPADVVVTMADREAIRRVHGDSQCMAAYVADDWSLCSCKGNSECARRLVAKGAEMAAIRAEAKRDVALAIVSALSINADAYLASISYTTKSEAIMTAKAEAFTKAAEVARKKLREHVGTAEAEDK